MTLLASGRTISMKNLLGCMFGVLVGLLLAVPLSGAHGAVEETAPAVESMTPSACTMNLFVCRATCALCREQGGTPFPLPCAGLQCCCVF
jgi:hypothetical protein